MHLLNNIRLHRASHWWIRPGSGIAAAGLAIALCAAAGPTLAAPLQKSAQGSGIDLQVTLGTDTEDGACGTDAQLDVTRLDQVNLCYTMTNHSGTTLTYQTLADNVVGTLLSAVPLVLPPGASTRYNRVITARESQAPVTTWTAYDTHPGYGFANDMSGERVFADGFDGPGGGSDYDWVEIAATGTPLDMLGSGFPVNVQIGFPFTYYGQTSDQTIISLEGGLLFGVSKGYLTFQNTSLPNADIGAAILPYWTDIEYPQPEDGNTYVQTIGTAPNRRFVVEWVNVPVVIAGIAQDGVTFEAILEEGSNRILFQYADTHVGDPARDNGITATIGLNPPPGVEAALQYSYLSASVNAGTAILFEPTTPTSFTSSQQVEINVGVPVVSVNPAQFNVSAAAGASTTSTLDIGNVGNRPLTWNLGSVAGNAHFPALSRFTLPMGDPAQTRGGPAPRASGKRVPDTPPAPFAEVVKAVAVDLGSSSLVSLDANNPVDPAPIAGVGDLILIAGDFVDEDFTKLYAIDYYTYHLLKVDTSTGETTLVGTSGMASGAGVNWAGMAWDASTDTLYATTSASTRDGLAAFLYKIDPVTAATTLVGPITGIGDPSDGTLVVDIAIDANGLMYGVDIVGDDFVAIDKSSGAASVIGSLGFDANFGQGLDFDDYTGTLYYAAFNNTTGKAEMYTIDPASGALTLLSPIGANPYDTQLTAFAIGRLGGICAYPNDVPWLSYSTTRGSTAAGDATPVNVTFDASTLATGTYNADICVSSNDMTNRRAAVPVTFTVH